MERYLEFRIDEQTTELKMEAFLKKNAGLTKRQISQAKFRPDGITRNGVRCRVTETIYPGDVIRSLVWRKPGLLLRILKIIMTESKVKICRISIPTKLQLQFPKLLFL